MKSPLMATALFTALLSTATYSLAKHRCPPDPEPTLNGKLATGLDQIRTQGRPMTVAERHILQHALLQGGNLLLQLNPPPPQP
ncbi:MAG: hypothetical protein KDH88_18800 [Chromatiales bacterium]|nr:hypothetical protein [Chromatiales bacterium]